MKFIAFWARTTDFALERFTRPPAGGAARGRAILIVAVLVLIVGLIDYVTVINISLLVCYLLPIGLAVAWLGWRSGIATAFASLLARVAGDAIAVGTPWKLPRWDWFEVVAAMLTYLIIIWILHALISLHRQLESRVEERTRALQDADAEHQRLEHELLEIGARERNAIGRELHDELGQHLVGTALAAQVLAQRLAGHDGTAAQDARAIVGWVEEGIAKTRQLARGLILEKIEPEQLSVELEELAATSSRGSVRCRFRQEGQPAVHDAVAAGQLFRIAQEATRNALRHARASQIEIILAGEGRNVILAIEDDGSGLPPPAARGGGMGLRIMEHRAALAGGVLALGPAPRGGTRVLCSLFPLPPPPAP